MTQSGLMRALNAVILHDGDTQGTGLVGQTGDSDMKLSRPGGQAAQQQPQGQPAEDPKPQPKGWGQKGAATPAADDQRDRIQDKINPEANRSAFTRGTQEQAANIENGQVDQNPETPADPQPARRTRGPNKNSTQEAPAAAPGADMALQFLGSLAGSYFKLQAVKIASQAHFAENFESTEDLFSLADEIGAYIAKPF